MRKASLFVTVALLGQIVLGSLVQAAKPVSNASGDLDQCANGTVSSPDTCTGNNWQNGNLNANNSHYAEGQSAPYRIVMEDLDTTSVHTLVLEYDIKHSSKHAIDYLTSFDRTESSADPCSGVTGCALSGTAAFPAPSSTGSPVVGQPTASFNALPAAERALSMYNAAIAGTGITYVSQGTLTDATASTRIQIQFTASNATAVFAWGGHIAAGSVWGAGNSAGGISGSPYHMRFISLDGSGGNQDRSLSADAVEATPLPATLIVIKDVVNDDAGTSVASDFTMNVSGTNVSTSSFPGSETGTSITLDAGSYTVTEGAATGYVASYSADCSGTIAAGETKTCTITNDDEDPAGPTTGTLTIQKTVVNDNGGQATVSDFDFFIYEAPGQVVDTQSGVQVQEGAQNTLPPGTYSVSEQGNGGGYYQATFSGACNGSPFVTLAAGEDLTCTITNDDSQAVVTVNKIVSGGPKTAGDFPLFVGQTSVTNGVATNIDAGSYVVSETEDQDYAATFSGDCDAQGNLTLIPGDNKECTITNTYTVVPEETGTITVVKVVSGGDAQVSDFPLFIGQTQVTSGQAETLPIGNYTISETNQPNYVASFSENCAGGNVSLQANDEVTCTITNTYNPPAPTTGNVTVTKVVINDDETGSSQVSDFTLSVGETVVTSGATNAFAAGSYVVSETGPSGYTATFSGACDENGNITVVAGESVTCTITNNDNARPPQETGTLTVVKVVINNDGGTAQVSDFPLFIGQTQVTSGTANSLPAGTYAVSETASADYVSAFSGDCDVNGIVNLEAGDEKTCTITNDDKVVSNPPGGGGSAPQTGTLIVLTVVINDGGGEAMPSSFLMTVGDGVSVSSTFGGQSTPGFSMAQAPGAFVVNGSMLPSYTQTKSANCAGTLSAGQTLTCVVTYTYQAPQVPPTGGSPTPPSGPVPQVLGDTDTDTTDAGPIPQVLGATDDDLPVTGMPAWTLSALLLAAAPFLRRKRA